MRKSFFAAAFLVASGLLPAAAQETARCPNARTEAEMFQCLEKIDAENLAEIATLESRLKASGEDEGLSKLIDDASRAWLLWRNAECRSTTFESRSGTGFGTIFAACLVELNATRLKTLRERAELP